MKRLKRYSRIVLTMLWLAMSAGAVGVYAYRHFRFPSVPETFPNGELVIAVDPSYPPFGNIVEDTFVGLDIDIGKALAAELGLTPRFVMVNFDSAYDAVRTGAADISLAGLRVDTARMGDVHYTWGYLNDGVMVVSSSASADGWALGGMRVGVELGAAGHAEARLWSRRVKAMGIETFETPDGALDALERGDVDAVLADAISVRDYLRRHPNADFRAGYLTAEFYSGAVRSGRRDVLYHLNGAMLTLLNDGTIGAMLERHIGAEPQAVSP